MQKFNTKDIKKIFAMGCILFSFLPIQGSHTKNPAMIYNIENVDEIDPITPFLSPSHKISLLPRKNLNSIETTQKKVLLQGYYWKTPDDGNWWSTLEKEIPDLSNTGFDAIWIPPFYKTKEGDTARCGYEPYDYYDLGEYDQKGSIETRYGSRDELESLISVMHSNEMEILGDIVINHCNGGDEEPNLKIKKIGAEDFDFTLTNFSAVLSGELMRNYSYFHTANLVGGDLSQYPISVLNDKDAASFGAFPDFDHSNTIVQQELLDWANWLSNEIGMDGWRFDVALGIIPEFLESWMNNVSGTGIAEYWTGSNMQVLDQENYLDDTNNTLSSFDFVLMYELRKLAFPEVTYDLGNLPSAGLLASRPDQAVTFVVNHDTYSFERNSAAYIPIEYRLLPYSFILTHSGYPMVYWDDYVDTNLRYLLKSLIQIRDQYVHGTQNVLYLDEDLYVMEWENELGLIYALNDNPTTSKQATISTQYSSVVLSDLLGKNENITVNSDGSAMITIPPYSFAVYSTEGSFSGYRKDNDTDSNIIPLIAAGDVIIDGKLDYSWPGYKFYDGLNDFADNVQNLDTCYISSDETNLYLAIKHGRREWTGENDVQYGIAFDTQIGGSGKEVGFHDEIYFGGTAKPDYIVYLQTDNVVSKNTFKSMKLYEYNETEWQLSKNYILDSDFATDIPMSIVELKIPLKDIGLEFGGDFNFKLFSSQVGKVGGADAIPTDTQTEGSGDSLSLFILEPLSLPAIEPNLSDDDEITDDDGNSKAKIDAFPLGIISIISGFVLMRKKEKIEKKRSFLHPND